MNINYTCNRAIVKRCEEPQHAFYRLKRSSLVEFTDWKPTDLFHIADIEANQEYLSK